MAKILIADDSDAIRMILKEIVMIDNHTVIGEAKDGAEAVELFSKLMPDLILLDLLMPKKDGIAVVKEIISKNPKARIILITASEDQQLTQSCIKSGALSLILKPFDFKAVLVIISDILGK